MIKVYVFVTGLVLYQFSPEAGGKHFALLAAGDYDIPGVGGTTFAHIAEHEVKVFAGEAGDPAAVATPMQVTFAAPCSGCAAVVPPPQILSLEEAMSMADGLDPAVKASCTTSAAAGSCPGPVPAGTPPGSIRASNGILAFTGGWKVEAVTDCGVDYPSDLQVADLNFVRAGRSWQLFRPGTNPLHGTNGVLFTTVVSSVSSVTSHGEVLPLLAPFEECEGLIGFDPAEATRCAVLLVRNGSDDPYHGGGDLHFAAFYPLLDNAYSNPADMWLPIAVGKEVCTHLPDGGGCGGNSNCVGAWVE